MVQKSTHDPICKNDQCIRVCGFPLRVKGWSKVKIGLKGVSKVLRVGFGLSGQKQLFGYFSNKKTG